MIGIEDLIVDPEFTDQIPPLDPDEYEKLEDNILEEGAVIDAIVVWKGEGIIVDGHHRYKIIKDHPEMDIRYEIYEKEFPDRYAAQAWMCSNQLGRRNLTPEQKRYLIGKQYEAAKQSEHFYGNQYTLASKSGLGQNDPDQKHGTRSRIAQENNTSDAYVKRAEKFAQGVDLADEIVPGTRQEILSRKIKPSDKEMSELLKTDDPDDRKKLIEGFHEDRRSSRPAPPVFSPASEEPDHDITDDDDEDDDTDEAEEDSPASYITLKHAKEAAASLNTTSGEETEDDVIYELNDALESLMFRWEFVVEHNPHAAKGPSFRRRRDELIKKGVDYLHDFKKRRGENQNESE